MFYYHTKKILIFFSLSFFSFIALTGCEESPADFAEDDDELTIVVEADKSRIQAEEKALSEKRSVMAAERQRIEKSRRDLEQRLSSISKLDQDQQQRLQQDRKRLDKQEREMQARIDQVASQSTALEAQKNDLLRKLSTRENANGNNNKAARSVEKRERQLRQREIDVAVREASLAVRQQKIESMQRETAETLLKAQQLLVEMAAAGTKTVIVQASGADGGRISRAQANKGIRMSKGKMSGRGILVDDLSPMAQQLHAEAQQAMSQKRYGEALAYSAQLTKALERVTVNREFVTNKMARLNRRLKQKKMSGNKAKRSAALLSQLNDAVLDERFDRANRLANQLAGLLK